MKCPHCLIEFHDTWNRNNLDLQDKKGVWSYIQTVCPSCENTVIKLLVSSDRNNPFMVYPKGIARAPLPAEVEERYKSLYSEACRVLSESPRASAALSRRCLQDLLRDKGGTTKRDLADQIEDVISSKKLPADLAEDLDVIRNVGNFGTHTQKSTHTGEILDVEPGEAEWNLDVLEELFDYFFVRPELRKKKRASLNEKLKAAGKPPLKETKE